MTSSIDGVFSAGWVPVKVPCRSCLNSSRLFLRCFVEISGNTWDIGGGEGICNVCGDHWKVPPECFSDPLRSGFN